MKPEPARLSSLILIPLLLAIVHPHGGLTQEEMPNVPRDVAMPKAGTAKRKLKVLVSNPAIAFSHQQYQGRLADILAEEGHEVHILMQAANPRVANYTGVSRGQRIWRIPRAPGKENDFLAIRFLNHFFSGPPTMLQTREGMKDFQRLGVAMCEEMFTADEGRLLAALEREHYDVGISESYFTCAFGLFKRLNIRTSLATVAVGLSPLISHSFGIPSLASWDTNFNVPSANGPAMGYWERVRNFYAHVLDMLTIQEGFTAHQQVFEKHFGTGLPSSPVGLMLNVSLLFVNRNEFFDLPHLLSNKVVNIGGIAVDKPTNAVSLPTHIEKILTKSPSSKKSVVLFSLGTMVDSSLMPHSLKRAFLRAFTRFPAYEFIWKYKFAGEGEGEERDPIENEKIPPNVHLFEWVEQKTLLRHPRLRAFITHCGLNSLNEAAHAGVPVLGLPLFGDQHLNAALVKWKRNGVVIWDVRTCEDEQTIVDALTAVLEDPIYTHNAELVSRKLRLSPFSPAERFVRWVEFAADYPQLNELNLPYYEFNFLTYYCLDVVAVTLAGMVAALLAVFWVIRCMLHGFLIAMRYWMGLTKKKKTNVKKNKED